MGAHPAINGGPALPVLCVHILTAQVPVRRADVHAPPKNHLAR